MVTQLWIFLSLLFFSHTVECMDIKEQDNSVLFAALSNNVRRKIIFPLLQMSKNVSEGRAILLAVAGISKQSYAQSNCPFFIKDVIHLLAKQHRLADGTVAQALHTPAAKKYKERGDHIFLLTRTGNFECNPFKKIGKLIDQGGNVNFGWTPSGETPLMRAVYINSPAFVEFILAKGGRVNMHDVSGRFVRDYNLIYDIKQLPRVLFAIAQRMLEIETHHATQTDKIDWHQEMYMLHQSIMLRNALLIDRMLEQKKAFCAMSSANKLLIKKLEKSSRIRRALKHIIGPNKQVIERSVPLSIQPYVNPETVCSTDRKKKNRHTA